MKQEQMLGASISFIRECYKGEPKIGLVLGSGLGDFGGLLKSPVVINSSDIPFYPAPSVLGHQGKLLFGCLENTFGKSSELLIFQGRVHLYECSDMLKVIYPIWVASKLGIQYLIVTNAAGGINRVFTPGDLMLIRDYINLTGEKPLQNIPKASTKKNENPFDSGLLLKAAEIARNLKIPYTEGIYCWTKGPSYESAAEIRMMARLGADAVGMSTVPEVIVACSLGIKVLGISCITNKATGTSDAKLSHAEVTEVANRVKTHFSKLVSSIIFSISEA
jgi:purine-nucleoside phosphorylase